MPIPANLSSTSIAAATQEADQLGMVPFRQKYHFSKARNVYMVRNGKYYEARPIIAATCVHQGLPPMNSQDFVNNDAHDFLAGRGFSRQQI